MPQMMPMNWLILFIMFSFTFMVFNSMIYYTFLYKPKKQTIKKSIHKIYWKW